MHFTDGKARQDATKRTNAVIFLVLAISFSLILQNKVAHPSTLAAPDSPLFKEATVLWERTYGGTGDDRAFCLASINRGFMVVGSSKSLELGKTSGWVLQLDHNGNVLWNRMFLEDV